MEAQEIIHCRGHPLVLGTHPTTFEVTREDHLTKNGNCIIGIAADKGCNGLSPAFKHVLSHDDAVLITRLSCDGVTVEVKSRGPHCSPWIIRPTWSGDGVHLSADGLSVLCPITWRQPCQKHSLQHLVAGKEMIVTLTAMRPG